MDIHFWGKQLNKYGESIYGYLQTLLPSDKIIEFLDTIKTKTHGEARQQVIDEHGLPQEVWYALYGLTRIEHLIECLEHPSDEPVQYEQALQSAILALHAGLGAGAVVDGHAKESMLQSLSPVAEHGKKFIDGPKSGGLSTLTIVLEDAYKELRENDCQTKGPTNKEVLKHLETSARWKTSIQDVDWESETVCWKGKNSKEYDTGFKAIYNSLSIIRKKYK